MGKLWTQDAEKVTKQKEESSFPIAYAGLVNSDTSKVQTREEKEEQALRGKQHISITS